MYLIFINFQKTKDIYEAIQSYRNIIIEYLIETKKTEPKLKFTIQVLDLFEALSSPQKLPKLVLWEQKYFPIKSSLDDDHKLYKLIFHGEIDTTITALLNFCKEKYSIVLNEQDPETYYFIIHEYLSKMPVLHKEQNNSDYSLLLDEWKFEMKQIRETFPKIKEKELNSILNILVGDENEIDSIGERFRFSWIEILIAKYIYIGMNPKYVQDLNINIKTQKDLLYYVFSEDHTVSLLKKELLPLWFLAHFSDLIYHEGRIHKVTRDKQIILFGESIYKNNWKIGMNYLLKSKLEYFKKVKITSGRQLEKMKIFCIKNNYPYEWLYDNYGCQTTNYYQLRGSDENKKIKAMNDVIEKYLKGNYIECNDFEFIKKFNQFLKDKKSVPIKELFDSPMRFWILILMHSVELLESEKIMLNKSETSFLMEKLTALCLSHQSEEHLKEISQSTIQEIRYALLMNQSRAILYQ